MRHLAHKLEPALNKGLRGIVTERTNKLALFEIDEGDVPVVNQKNTSRERELKLLG